MLLQQILALIGQRMVLNTNYQTVPETGARQEKCVKTGEGTWPLQALEIALFPSELKM